MTIGFDASRAFVKDKTGTENYSYQLLRAISKIDRTNLYMIYLRPGQIQEVKKENWSDNFKFSEINLPRFWTQLGLAWKSFTDEMDVLFVPSHTLPLIRKPGLRTVITVHDLGAEYLPSFHQLKQVLYLNFMTHYQLKTASKIIAVSKATKEDIVKKVGLERGKIKVIYEAVNSKAFSTQSSAFGKTEDDSQRDILRQYGLEKGKYFLFVGTIQPRKNLERIIRSIAEFLKWEVRNPTSHLPPPTSNFKLVLAGKKGWKSDDIYSLPAKLGIDDSVIFTGRVSDQKLKVLYNSAIALTYPSLFEGFGLPILEAFASKCPVITSNVSSMAEVAGNAAVLVNPESEKEISEAMVKIVKNDMFRNIMIQRGTKRVKLFSWSKAAKETIKVFEETGA